MYVGISAKPKKVLLWVAAKPVKSAWAALRYTAEGNYKVEGSVGRCLREAGQELVSASTHQSVAGRLAGPKTTGGGRLKKCTNTPTLYLVPSVSLQ